MVNEKQDFINCPWCGSALITEQITDKNALGGVSHLALCPCGMSALLADVLAGTVGKITKEAAARIKQTAGYRIEITSTPYRLIIWGPRGGYRLTAYQHPNPQTSRESYLSCTCQGYTNSAVGTCKHVKIGYRWLADRTNVEACKAAWQIGVAA